MPIYTNRLKALAGESTVDQATKQETIFFGAGRQLLHRQELSTATSEADGHLMQGAEAAPPASPVLGATHCLVAVLDACL